MHFELNYSANFHICDKPIMTNLVLQRKVV